MKRRILLYALALVLCGPLLAFASESLFKFTKIVDTNTPVPDGTGNFVDFYYASLEGGDIYFIGREFPLPPYTEKGGADGVYRVRDGALSVIADTRTFLPGTNDTFTLLWSLSTSGKNIVFEGRKKGSGSGVYASFDGVLETVANGDTPSPMGLGTFEHAYAPTINGSTVVFAGQGPFPSGIFLKKRSGEIEIVVNTQSMIPEGNGRFRGFCCFSPPVEDSGQVAFHAFGGEKQQGVYTITDGTLHVVADVRTLVSGGLLDQFTDVFLDNGTITFEGLRDHKPVEILRYKAGAFSTLLGPETPIPRAGFVFGDLGTVYFRVVSVDGDNVAFEFSGPSNTSHISGTYIWTGTALLHLRDPHTLLDGKNVGIVRISRDGLDGTSLAFVARFQDGTRAVYRADLMSGGQ